MKHIILFLILISGTLSIAQVQTLKGRANVQLQKDIILLDSPNFVYNVNAVFWNIITGIVTAPIMIGDSFLIPTRPNFKLVTKRKPIRTSIEINLVSSNNTIFLSASDQQGCNGFSLMLTSQKGSEGTLKVSIPGHMRADYFSGNSESLIPDLTIAELQRLSNKNYLMSMFLEQNFITHEKNNTSNCIWSLGPSSFYLKKI